MKKTVQDYIRTIPDFPHEGIMFRDVTTLFADPRGFRMAVDLLLHPYIGEEIDQLATGFLPIRKKGKLPGRTIEQDYVLEYGTATVEIHDDAIKAGDQILLVDDLLATGGTAEAGVKLIEQLGGTVIGCAFVIDLPELGGRKRLESMGLDVHCLCAFDGA